jgi:Ni/Fe-hydrogenase subunit HybB-like protein
MLIAVAKIHPLWHTSLLPLLALISCLSMGYGAVVVLTNLLKMKWNAERDQKVLAGLSKANAYLLLAYSILRVGDIVVKGRARYLLAFGDWHLYFFLVEMALFLVPAFMFLKPAVQASASKTFSAALMSIWAGALWRVDAYLTAYNPGNGWEYFPSLGELTVTVGMAAVGVAVFLFIARTFPVVVIAGKPAAGAAHAVAAPASNH